MSDKIRSSDEPVGRMAKLMAALYTHMAQELVDRLGENEGHEAIRRAIKGFADQRIASMHEEANERGLPINGQTYSLVRDMPGQGWIRSKDNPDDILYCPMFAMWQQQGADDLARLYCEIDTYLFEAFQVEMKRPYCLSEGHDRCRFNLTAKKTKPDDESVES